MKLPVFPWEDGLVTDAQVRRLREKRMEGKTVSAAAAAAGMGERTAHRWQRGALPSAAKAPRTWRTREDPFAAVWLSEVVPRLVADAAGRLQALTLFEWLCEQHPGRFEPGQLRTLQRRVRAWRAQHGPDHEVYFEQVAVPGREAAFDLHGRARPGSNDSGCAVPAPVVRVGAELQRLDVCGAGAERDVRGACGGCPRGAVDAGRGAGRCCGTTICQRFLRARLVRPSPYSRHRSRSHLNLPK